MANVSRNVSYRAHRIAYRIVSWAERIVSALVSVAILTDGVLTLLPPPNGEGYVFISVGWFACVSVSDITGKFS